jgi:hypothetical protein
MIAKERKKRTTSMEAVQDAAAAGKEGDKEGRRCRGGGDNSRGSGARKYIAVEDLAPLLSGLPQRGTRSSGATKPTAAGDVARLFGEVAEKSSHPRISLPLMISQVHFVCC